MQQLIRAGILGLALISPAVAQQPATMPDGTQVYLSKAPDDAMSIGNYYNRNVYNRAGEKLGDINDILLTRDRAVSTAIIGVGGFLGIGEKEVAVPFERLQIVQSGNSHQLVLDTTREALQSAPAFTRMASGTGMTTAPSTTPTATAPTTPPVGSPAPATTPSTGSTTGSTTTR